MKARSILIVVFAALLLALPMTLYAQETDPGAVVTSFFEALNAGDADGAMAYFAEGAVLAIVPFAAHTGTEEIRAYLEGVTSLNGTVTYENLQVEGDSVTMTSWYTDDDLQAMGLTLEGAEVIVVQDGKIVTDTWTATDETMAALQAAMAPLPETGGVTLPIYTAVMALGGLLAGGGLALKRRR